MNASPKVIPYAETVVEQTRSPQPGSGLTPCNPLDDPAWDTRVAAHPGASFFHTSAWARVLQDTYGHKPVYFCRRGGDRLDQLLPVMEVRSPFSGCRGVSLPFTDACPALGSESEDTAGLYGEAMEYSRARGWKYFEVRGGFLQWQSARPSVSFVGHRLDLQRSEKELLANLESSMRRGLRKAESSGLSVGRFAGGEAIRAFYRLHCLTRRRHGVPPQPYRFFNNIARHVLAAGQGWVFTVTHKHRPVAAAVFFHHNRRAMYKFGASDPDFQQFRPNNLLMWEAIKWYAANGFESLDFGRTSMANEGLRRFKLGFGTQEEKIDYCRFDFGMNRFVTSADRAQSWVNPVFQRLPLPLLRLMGAALYPHLS